MRCRPWSLRKTIPEPATPYPEGFHAMNDRSYGDVSVRLDDLVATVELHRPPNNHFDMALVRSLADAFEALDEDPACRAIVLCSEGRHFCAGADLRPDGMDTGPRNLYVDA